MKGRTAVKFSLAFLAGAFVGGWLTLPPTVYLAVALLFSLVSLRVRSGPAILFTVLVLGAASVQVGRMPPRPQRSALWQHCSAIQSDVSERLGALVPDGDEQAVLKALVIGDRSGIGRELRGAYSRSGAMHLLALSGLHIGIIYKILDMMLFFLGGSYLMMRLKSALIVISIWAFALVSGMSPSIARAALMITIYEMSDVLHSRRDGLTSLSVSCIIIILLDPESPRQVSFQLSFCSCAAIFVIYPRLKSMMSPRSRLLGYVWRCLSLAISCQLATGPLSYHYFGTFPRYFMITNLLSVPLVVSIMYLAAVSVVTFSMPHCSGPVADLLYHTLSALNFLVGSISNL